MRAQQPFVEASVPSAFVAALSIEEFTLLLPQHELRTFEPIADVETDYRENNEVGWIDIAGVKYPVYCISHDFLLLKTIPDERRIAVLLTLGKDMAGILCDELKIVSSKAISAYPMPECMNIPVAPFTGLAIYNNTICGMSSAPQLLSYLYREGEPQALSAQS